VSAAASIWQQGLIKGFTEQGAQIEVVTHLPCQAFPKGSLWPRNDCSIFPKDLVGHPLDYINLPKVREWFLRWQYQKIIDSLTASSQFDVLVSYNAEAYVTRPVAKIAAQMNIPWVGIIADLPSNHLVQYLQRSQLARADGRIFLSWKNFSDFAVNKSDYFLEGGVYPLPFEYGVSHDGITRIAYFGGITKLGGIELFLNATRALVGDQYEFHIIGLGQSELLEPFLKTDKRIIYHGALSQEGLIRVGKQMDIFVDPRPQALSENNFPSKILTYLSFGKPIISSMGKGIPPEYQPILIDLPSYDALSLAKLIEKMRHWSPDNLRDYRQKVEIFVSDFKSWDLQAQRAFSWLNALLSGKFPQ
jgi:glycosyltransferase involved in cell wall biosynthesis